MVNALRDIRAKYTEIFHTIPTEDQKIVEIKNEHWIFIDKFCEAYRPFADCTEILQSQQLSLSKYKIYFNLRLISDEIK
jgi:hypothetical protein